MDCRCSYNEVSCFCCQQAEVPEDDSDDEVDPDEVFGFISLLNLTERKVEEHNTVN